MYISFHCRAVISRSRSKRKDHKYENKVIFTNSSENSQRFLIIIDQTPVNQCPSSTVINLLQSVLCVDESAGQGLFIVRAGFRKSLSFLAWL